MFNVFVFFFFSDLEKLEKKRRLNMELKVVTTHPLKI